jgi:uncharacterized protein YjbI with pentapeptide repeats
MSLALRRELSVSVYADTVRKARRAGSLVPLWDGSKDLSGTNLSMLDLSGARFPPGMRFDNCIFTGTNFEDAELPSAHFDGANLYRTRLDQAWMSYAHFVGTSIAECSLRNARLENALFQGGSITSTKMTNTLLTYASFLDVKGVDVDVSGSRSFLCRTTGSEFTPPITLNEL